jgi:hypothetical protein
MDMKKLPYIKNTMYYNDFAAMFLHTMYNIYNTETVYVYLKFHMVKT